MSLPKTFRALFPSLPVGSLPKVQQVPLVLPGKDQILVKMEYATINPVDEYIMLGYNKYLPQNPHPVGTEGSGTVVAIGTDLKISHKVGDKVHVTGFGSMADYYLAKSEDCSPILNNLSFEEASSHYINPATVYYMGVRAERGGHKAAVHTVGSSQLGKMLIRYFKLKGIKLINLVRRDEAIEELKKEGADYVLNMKWPDFEERLKEVCEKENATLAFDAVGGDLTNKILKCLQPKAECLVYGCMSSTDVHNINIMELFKGKTVGALGMFDYAGERKEKGTFNEFLREINALLPVMFTTKVAKVFKLEEIEEALPCSQASGSKGKVLLKLN